MRPTREVKIEVNPIAAPIGADPEDATNYETPCPTQATQAAACSASSQSLRAQQIAVREVCKHRLSGHFTSKERIGSIWGESEFQLRVYRNPIPAALPPTSRAAVIHTTRHFLI